jgi:hypothetical protein
MFFAASSAACTNTARSGCGACWRAAHAADQDGGAAVDSRIAAFHDPDPESTWRASWRS